MENPLFFPGGSIEAMQYCISCLLPSTQLHYLGRGGDPWTVYWSGI